MSQKGQIYKRIFPRNRGYCVYYCVYQHPWISPSFSWKTFSHVVHLDQ